MYATEIEKRYIKRHSGLEMFKALAESQTQARKAAKVSTNGEVRSLDMTGRDVARIRVSADWDRGSCPRATKTRGHM